MVIIRCLKMWFLLKLRRFRLHSFNLLVCGPVYASVCPIAIGHNEHQTRGTSIHQHGLST
jgi:hypothetical protein